ncbi:MAG TPA: glycoside hydrolase family 2 TIM barrel-domain containing protein [Chitinispirillaceae bacterium]|nr:glycoside hydrolase family 2 TIM barrel-domain containing protein [Chitinispirillaceae bacterium]
MLVKMTWRCLVIVALGALILHSETYQVSNSKRITTNLDTGWLFNKSDNASFSGGTSFNDAAWNKVCIPHSNVITKHAFLDTASYRIITWYRKHFTPSAALNGRRFLLEFQGVSIVATVYVNGVSVGSHKGAYTPFIFDITDKVKVGQDNVIAVKVDSKKHDEIPPECYSKPNMDFIVFGGIVRPVTLITVDPMYIDWTFVATQNPSQEAPSNPVVLAKTNIINRNTIQKKCTVITNIVDGTNTIVAKASSEVTLPANGALTVSQTTSAISSPRLWSIDSPNLYNVSVQLQDESGCIDEYRTRMGIRSLTFNKTDGLCYLNGQVIKLRGLNRHETYPYIGRAAPKRLQRKDADILKYELGCNLVRASHYPQAPDFLDRCDEIGLLVLEEIPGWQYLDKGSEWRAIEMQTLVDMVKRDRNHPCILSWGTRANETQDDQWYELTDDSAKVLDPTRLTHGVRFNGGEKVEFFYEDVWTRNFKLPTSLDPIPYITTEFAGHTVLQQAHSWDDDQILVNQIMEDGHGHGFGLDTMYGAKKWAGLIGWCAFDYNSPHRNATNSDIGRGNMSFVSPHGVSSIFRLPKLAAYFYQSQRDPALYGPMVHICSYWTPNSLSNILVVSNCDEVELYQDGVLVSTKKKLYTNLPYPCFLWTGVKYKPGELKAIGSIGGVQKVTHSVWNPGNPTTLLVQSDTNVIYENGDMTRVVVSLLDEHGQILHLRADSITLSASGAGDFIGETKTVLEGGQMAFYVKTRADQRGTITCQASCAGLSGTASISVIEDKGLMVENTTTPAARVAVNRRNVCYTNIGTKIITPHWVGKNDVVLVYDCSGKLLVNTKAEKNIELKRFGVAPGLHVVRIINKKQQ